jgi:peptidoglycan/LPS O-acetylase OafA/YrhL
MKPGEPTYRPDIDGLRAVAVAAVMGYHAFPRHVSGGFVGVDIFFVISGFLISGTILRELDAQNFSFARFYARRVRRIFPSLIVVLLASFVLGWVFLIPEEFTSLGKNMFGGAAFSSNIVLLTESSYFDIAAARKALLHLWSLGIEEQFYLLWPLMLVATVRRGRRMPWLIAILLAASFALNIARITTRPDATFYLLDTRAWELLAGCLLATISGVGKGVAFADDRSSIFANVCALLGIGLIAASVFGLTHESSFPGWAALLPTAGAFLLISSDGAWFNRNVLACEAAVFIGLISYPLYLWHWPLLSFATVVNGGPPAVSTRAAALVGSIVLAWLTYVAIEQPVRFVKSRRTLKTAFSCVLMAVVGLVGLVTYERHGFDFRIPEAVRDIATVNAGTVDEWRKGQCLFETNDDRSKFVESCIDRNRRPLVFLWGDSIAAALYPGLREAQLTYNFGLGQFTTAGCPPIPGFVVANRPRCKDNNDFALELIEKHKPEIVLIQSAWAYQELGFALEDLGRTIAALRDHGATRIVVLGPPVQWGPGLPQAIVAYYQQSARHQLIPERTTFLVGTPSPAEGFFRARAPEWAVEYISVRDAMCNAEGCLARVGPAAADVTAFDSIHLTRAGSKYLASAIVPQILRVVGGTAHP